MAYATPISKRTPKSTVDDSELLFQFNTPFSNLGTDQLTEPDDATLYSTSQASTLVSIISSDNELMDSGLPSLSARAAPRGDHSEQRLEHRAERLSELASHVQHAPTTAAAAFAGHLSSDPRHLLVSALPSSDVVGTGPQNEFVHTSRKPVSPSRLFSKYNNYLGQSLSPMKGENNAPSVEQLRELERMVEQIWMREGGLTEDMFEDSSDEER